MDQDNRDYVPGEWGETSSHQKKEPNRSPLKCSLGSLIVIVAVVAMIAVIFTYTLTSNANRAYYTEKLAQQQKLIPILSWLQLLK